jgi:hypothetical protein
MSDLIERPNQLRVNAWTGDGSPADTLPPRTPWGQRLMLAGRTQWLAPAVPADERDWRHRDVGWGVVLPDNDELKPDERATAAEAPEAIAKLLAARPGSPVLRWRSELQQGYLRRYYPGGKWQDLSAQAPRPGLGEGRIPQYLLICASPEKIPWAVQYALNMSTFVGRLDPDGMGDGLDNYVAALIDDWAGQTCDPRAPVVWSADWGKPDITWLMAGVIADKLWTSFQADTDLSKACRLTKEDATREALAAALAERTPALVVTTSHGMTGPLTDAVALQGQLGAPIDARHQVVAPSHLTAWKPSGAIWYAHACCSAGADSASRYKGLLSDDSEIGSMLNRVAAAAGARVAPLANALLGAPQPLRAFVGHVEPTFDWTLRDPTTNQAVGTHVLQKSLYNELYQQDSRYPTPIGYALRHVYKEAGNFYGSWQEAVQDVNKNVPGSRDWALYRQLVAMDRQTLVILGDPTVALPRLG